MKYNILLSNGMVAEGDCQQLTLHVTLVKVILNFGITDKEKVFIVTWLKCLVVQIMKPAKTKCNIMHPKADTQILLSHACTVQQNTKRGIEDIKHMQLFFNLEYCKMWWS